MESLSQKQCCHCKKFKEINQFYKAGKNKIHAACKTCHKASMSASYHKHREINLKSQKQYRKKAKKEALEHYGGKCVCCGEFRYEFLSFDHINGGGRKHSKSINGMAIGIWLRKNNYPDGFRILCHNCNQALGHFGYCPHQKD